MREWLLIGNLGPPKGTVCRNDIVHLCFFEILNITNFESFVDFHSLSHLFKRVY